jgi:hypothetical protein
MRKRKRERERWKSNLRFDSGIHFDSFFLNHATFSYWNERHAKKKLRYYLTPLVRSSIQCRGDLSCHKSRFFGSYSVYAYRTTRSWQQQQTLRDYDTTTLDNGSCLSPTSFLATTKTWTMIYGRNAPRVIATTGGRGTFRKIIVKRHAKQNAVNLHLLVLLLLSWLRYRHLQ